MSQLWLFPILATPAIVSLLNFSHLSGYVIISVKYSFMVLICISMVSNKLYTHTHLSVIHASFVKWLLK